MKHWNEKCALIGIWNHHESSLLSYLGLYAQQHRGQEGAGIVSVNKDQFLSHKGLGLVGEVFNEKNLASLKGNSSIGHTRYTTRGESQDENSLQPLVDSQFCFSIAHNGQFVNFKSVKEQLIQDGFFFQGSSDTECLIHLIHQRMKKSLSFHEALIQSLSLLEGAYSLVLLTPESLIAVRDPRGFRPLVLGKKKSENGMSYVVASETCAFDLLSAEYIREIEQGEVLTISQGNKLSSTYLNQKEKRKACVFEHIYFARPDSYVFGSNVYLNRKKLGKALAQESPVDADVVVPVPDSGVVSALGYSEESKIPFELGITRNHYVGRTFIHPSSSVRNFKVKIKLNPQTSVIKGKRVIVIDDSIVRGTTSKAIVKILLQAGAKEVHFRVASPPVIGPCHYGVDTPQKSQLIAAQKNLEEIREYLEADSLCFLSVEKLMSTMDSNQNGFCNACFTHNYPTRVESL